MLDLQIIKGGIAEDHRGDIRFVNDFDMSKVKRFYIIKNIDTDIVRGWRGHKIEQRWFYVISGMFSIAIVKIDNWDKPDPNLAVRFEKLLGSDLSVLNIPAGFAVAFKALEAESEMLVFADYSVEHSVKDDYTWPLNYFTNFG